MNQTEAEKFWAKADRIPDQCWPWQGCIASDNGYGKFKGKPAHRTAFELAKGPIPPGYHIDHTCHDPTLCQAGRDCPHRRYINPDHLEAVTPQVNVLRSNSFAAINATRTHCKNGHEFTPANTYREKAGRHCIICRREAVRRYAHGSRKAARERNHG